MYFALKTIAEDASAQVFKLIFEAFTAMNNEEGGKEIQMVNLIYTSVIVLSKPNSLYL